MTATMTPTTMTPTVVSGRIESLSGLARQLWTIEPSCEAHLRAEILLELTDVSIILERLGVRARTGPVSSSDQTQLDTCAARLGRIRRYWNQDA